MPPIVPIVDEAASFVVTMLILPVVSMLACRLFAASAVLSSLRVETCPAPVPKVMLVAVPPPVAPIVSVSPLSAGGVSCVVPAVRPRAVSVPALPPITSGVVVPVLRVSLVAPSVEATVAPVMVSTAASRSPTVALVRSSDPPFAVTVLPPELVNEIVLPSIVRLSEVVMAVVNALSLVVVAVAPAMAVPVTVLLLPGPSRLVAVAPVMAVDVTLDFVE